MTDRPHAATKRAGRAHLAPRPKLVLRFGDTRPLTDDLFATLSAKNPDLRLERNATGGLEINAPAGGGSAHRNFLLTYRLAQWTEGEGRGLGVGFDSSAGFALPDGSILSPDASWVEIGRWNALSKAERAGFLPLCPDFVVELRSESDRPAALRKKMLAYLAQGARLGWLIDPIAGTVRVYRPGGEAEDLIRPTSLSGEEVLPGFVLRLEGVMEP